MWSGELSCLHESTHSSQSNAEVSRAAAELGCAQGSSLWPWQRWFSSGYSIAWCWPQFWRWLLQLASACGRIASGSSPPPGQLGSYRGCAVGNLFRGNEGMEYGVSHLPEMWRITWFSMKSYTALTMNFIHWRSACKISDIFCSSAPPYLGDAPCCHMPTILLLSSSSTLTALPPRLNGICSCHWCCHCEVVGQLPALPILSPLCPPKLCLDRDSTVFRSFSLLPACLYNIACWRHPGVPGIPINQSLSCVGKPEFCHGWLIGSRRLYVSLYIAALLKFQKAANLLL